MRAIEIIKLVGRNSWLDPSLVPLNIIFDELWVCYMRRGGPGVGCISGRWRDIALAYILPRHNLHPLRLLIVYNGGPIVLYSLTPGILIVAATVYGLNRTPVLRSRLSHVKLTIAMGHSCPIFSVGELGRRIGIRWNRGKF